MSELIFGTDSSRFQPLGSYEPGAFEIINGQEPDGAGGGDFTATLQRNAREGRPQGVYIWGYPNGGYAVEEVVARTRGVLGGDPELGYWLDHEEAGIAQHHIDAALGVADALGVRMGIYTYLHLLPQVNLRGRDLWLAYYPGNNDGNYQPRYSDTARQHGAKLHQFSSGGGLDRNVVIDEAWYQALTNAPFHSTGSPMGDDVIRRLTEDIPDVAAKDSLWISQPQRWERVDTAAAGVPVQGIDANTFMQIRADQDALRALLAGNVGVGVSGSFTITGSGSLS